MHPLETARVSRLDHEDTAKSEKVFLLDWGHWDSRSTMLELMSQRLLVVFLFVLCFDAVQVEFGIWKMPRLFQCFPLKQSLKESSLFVFCVPTSKQNLQISSRTEKSSWEGFLWWLAPSTITECESSDRDIEVTWSESDGRATGPALSVLSIQDDQVTRVFWSQWYSTKLSVVSFPI